MHALFSWPQEGHMNKVAIVVFLAWAVLSVGCGAPEPEMGSEGTYGGPCYEDGSCDEGLKCVYHVCKEG